MNSSKLSISTRSTRCSYGFRLYISFILIVVLHFCSIAQQSKGVGVVFLKKSLYNKPELLDSMDIYESSGFKNKIALFYVDPNDRFNVGLSQDLNISYFEFDYETFGLPIEEININSIKVIYGYSDDGEARSGFIRKDTTNYEWRIWSDFLLGYPVFFQRNVEPIFFAEFMGVEELLELPNRTDVPKWKDYIMYPKEIRGDWMKVEVVAPSDYCEEPKLKQSKILWINHLDENGELKIWYYVRGC